MEAGRQTSWSFWEMLQQLTPKKPSHEARGEEVIQTTACVEGTPSTNVEPSPTSAQERDRALTQILMEQVVDPVNLNRAYARVKSNKGAPGADGMTVGQLAGWIRQHKQKLIASLLDGSYQPQPVRGVQIPKPAGKLDSCVWRKLRCLRLKQCRFMQPIANLLMKLAVPRRRAWLVAQSGQGWWALSDSPGAHEGMSLA